MTFRQCKTSPLVIAVLLSLVFITFTRQYCVAASGCDGAGNCYIRSGASGANNGSSWTNAYTSFSSVQWAPGQTYWIAAGSYGSVTLSATGSSASLITLRAALPANHGSASDWNDSYAGTAAFSHVALSGSYWVIDGQQRGSAGCISTPSSCTPADWRTGYHIVMNSNGSEAVALSGAHNALQYVELVGKNTTNVDDFGVQEYSSNAHYFTFDHGYVHDTGNSQFQINYGVPDHPTISYTYIYHNHSANDGTHDEALAMPATNASVHHNIFQDIQSTSVWSDASGGTPATSNWDFYGNLVFADNSFSAGTGGGVIHLNGTNIFSGTMHVYNNTVANMKSDAEFVTWNNTPSATVLVENNVSCNGAGVGTGTSGTQDYNAYYCGDSGASGSHDTSSSSNPFQNAFPSALGSSWDARLSSSAESSMSAGLTLASPYNTSCDLSNGWCVNGNATLVRGSSGKWDRGAIQYTSGGSATLVNPPTNLSAQVQ
jgi:hypothetical protein